MMKTTTVSVLLKGLLARANRAMFGRMVKSGMILCAADAVEGEQPAEIVADATSAQDDITDPAPGTENDGEGEDGALDEEHIVTIGEEAPPPDEEEADAPGLVNKLRKVAREKDRDLRELRAKLAAQTTAAPAEVAKVVKPTLADCDFDEDVYEAKLIDWKSQQDRLLAEQKAQADRVKAEQDAWQATLANHDKAKAALKVRDYDDAEAAADELLSVTQRGIIIAGAENSALVKYALGKNVAKAKELASIKDPVKFAFAVARLESQLKITPRKSPPPPEKIVRGSAPIRAGSTDAQLEKLEAEAERTGDRTKVQAFKRELRRAAA